MMRFAGLMICVCLAAGGYLHAAPDKDKAATTRETAAEKSGTKDQPGARRTQKPVKTFKPSERIRADSAVSFPVDI